MQSLFSIAARITNFLSLAIARKTKLFFMEYIFQRGNFYGLCEGKDFFKDQRFKCEFFLF